MAGNWFKKLFGNKAGQPVSGRNRPSKTHHPNPSQGSNLKGKRKSEVKPDLSFWGRVKMSVGCLFGRLPKGSNTMHTLIEVNSEYWAHKSNFSAWLPCMMLVGLCLVLERPYPFTDHQMERFANLENIDTLLTPLLMLPAVVMLTHFLGCFWNLLALRLGQGMVRFTHTFGRLLDVGLATFVYRGLLNLLKIWEAVDRKLPIGCIRRDQCAVGGSVCHEIMKFVSYPHILVGDTTGMCDDGESKKLGQLLLNFLILLIILSGLFTLRIFFDLKTLEIERAPIRVTLTRGKSKKVREIFPDEETTAKLVPDDMETQDPKHSTPIKMPVSAIPNPSFIGIVRSPVRQMDRSRSGSKSKVKKRKSHVKDN